MQSSPEPDLLRLVLALAEANADFVIIGGLALQIHGGDYFTVDADFAYTRRRENAKQISAAIAPYHPHPTGWPEGVPFVWDDRTLMNSTVLTLDTDLGRVDFLAEPEGAPAYKVLRERSTQFEVHGKVVHVCSIEDLISMKRAAGRPKDIAHIAELETIQKLLREEG